MSNKYNIPTKERMEEIQNYLIQREIHHAESRSAGAGLLVVFFILGGLAAFYLPEEFLGIETFNGYAAIGLIAFGLLCKFMGGNSMSGRI